MGNIPITTPQVGPGLGVSNMPLQRTGGMAGRTLEAAASDAEAYLTKIAEQDAAVEGLNRMADFKVAQAQRLAELQTSITTPEGFTPLALQDFDKSSQEFLKAIENPRTARFVESRMPEIRSQVAGTAISFETNQRQAVRTQNFDQSVNKLATMAQMDLGAYEGARADVLASLEAGRFEPAEAGKLRMIALSNLARSAVFGELERNPQAMLDRLNKGEFPDLDAGQRLQAVNAAQGEIKRREAQAKADAQLVRQEAMVSVSEWMRDDIASRSETGRGVEAPAGVDLAMVLKPAEAEKLQRQQDKADRLYQATASLPTQAPEQMLATVEALKPQPGQADYANQNEFYQAARQRMDKVLSDRASDPAAYARQTFSGVQQAWQKFEASQAPADLQAAVRANLNAQASVGIPAAARKPLPAGLAKSYAQQVTGAKPEEAYNTLRGLASDFGPLWPAALSQMARDLPANYKVAATIDDAVNASILIQSSRQSLQSLRTAAGADATAIRDDIAGNSEIKALGQAFGLGGARLTAEIMNAAEVLALGRAVTLGDSDAVGSAVKAIVTDRYAFGYSNSKPFAVPNAAFKNRISEIEDGANVALSLIDPNKLTLPVIDPAVDRKVQANSYLGAIRRNGYWTNYEGGGGIQLMSERNVPVMVDGQPLRLTWAELVKLNSETPRPVSNSYVTGKVGVPAGATPRKTTPPASAPQPAPAAASPPAAAAPARASDVTTPAPQALSGTGAPAVLSEADMIAQGRAQAADDARRQQAEAAREAERMRKELQRIGRERRERKPDGK
jgi:hypothetical protein